MTLPSKRKWLPITILAVVIPIGLLTAFKLTGIIPEPPTIAETILCDPVAWNMTRPTKQLIPPGVTIIRWINNTYKNVQDEAYINFSIMVIKYYENDPGAPAYGNDYVKLRIVATANSRRGVNYHRSIRDPDYRWYEAYENFSQWMGDYDDGYGIIHLINPVRFYGGPRSAEYNTVYVSVNGFITFKDPDGGYPYYSASIPSEMPPDLFIAPFWRDLDLYQGGSITYDSVLYSGREYLLISWNGVPNKKNGVEQFFQVLIQLAPGFGVGGENLWINSRIWFFYKDVTIDDDTTIGIEDQTGWRGESLNPNELENHKAILFQQSSNNRFIESIKIDLDRHGNSDALIDISGDPSFIRGHNVRFTSPEQDSSATFALALTGGSVLLLEALSGALWVQAGCFIIGVTIAGIDISAAASSTFFREADPLQIIDDGNPGEPPHPVPLSYASVETLTEQGIHNVVDGSLGIVVYWIFTDQNTKNHRLTVTAEMQYAEYVSGAVIHKDISTSIPIELKMTPDIGQTFNTAKSVSAGTYYGCLDITADFADMYSFNVSSGYVIDITMTPAWDADYDLHLYNPDHDEVPSYHHSLNSTENIVHLATTTGTYYLNITNVYWPGHLQHGVYRLVVDEPYLAPRVTVLTKTTGGADIEDVLVMIGLGCWHTSPIIDLSVLPDIYWVYVEPVFERERGHYSYTFQQWNDGSTSYSRYITIDSDISLTAYYEEQFFNDPPNIPSRPSGPTSGYTDTSYTYTTSTTDPDGDDVYYQFSWGDGYTTVGPKASGDEASASHSWSSAGLYYVHSRAKDVYRPWGAWSEALPVSISSGGGDGGCPYAYTWNGSAFVLDNNVLGMSEVSNGSDVEDFYRLEQTVVPYRSGTRFSVYSLMLGEFENEHSYIDKVRLIAVDHDPNVNVAVTPEGQILTYANPNSPVSAVDNYGCDWLPAMLEADDTYYRGFPEDYLLLDFGTLDVSQAAKLVLRANVEWKKDTCIHVQVLNETGDWTDATALRTRYHWSTLIVDLADYLPNPDGTLKIRLYFTGIHKIDYVGLDTTPQASIEVRQAKPISAIHSTQGNVRWRLLKDDEVYAELVPGEQITLKFILPNTEKTRTFMIQIEGHYHIINN